MLNRFLALVTAGALIWGNAMAAENLAGSEWGPVELNGAAFAPISEVFVQFQQDGRYFGNDGCNTVRGSFVTNGDAILFGPAAATMMACPENIMAQASAFMQALSAARSFERDGTFLLLSDADGAAVLRLQQRDAD